MTAVRGLMIGLVACVWVMGCGKTSPTAPTSGAAPTSGPRILLAGQSGAYFLLPYLPEAIDFSNIDGSINYSFAVRRPDRNPVEVWRESHP